MRVRNRMEFMPADSPERQMLADNLLRAILHGRLPEADLEKICATNFSTERFCLLDIDGSAVGTISLRALTDYPGIWEIRSLAVTQAWQRGGLAQFMFNKTLATARAQGARRLQATLHSSLTAAAEFFAKNAFIPEDPAFIPPPPPEPNAPDTATDDDAPQWEMPVGLYTIYRDL